jgi:hypothetical protein
MEHLNEEQLVMHHYHDDESPAAAAEHLMSCAQCRREFDAVRRILAIVNELPVPDRGPAYGDQVWNRLRWRMEGRRRRTWQSMIAAAAILAVAFFAGQFWHARNAAHAPAGSSAEATASREAVAAANTAAAGEAGRDRVLLVVVSDHLDSSERMLLELANADAKHGRDMSTESVRAADLVATNRIYRQAATRNGDARIAALLADIEPVLLELANAGSTLPPEKIKALQKRIEDKGLLFKVRLVSADAEGRETPAVEKGINSL